MPVTEEEAELAKRIRLVRTDHAVSQRLVAAQIGLSRDQLERIERAEVPVRFFTAWNFCQFTDTNPLWLAFGGSEGRFGFIACANSTVQSDATFLPVMRVYGERYRTYRFLEQATLFEVGSVFSDQDSLLTAEYVQVHRRPAGDPQLSKDTLEQSKIKLYLKPSTMPEPLTWPQLRRILRSQTQYPQQKTQLAKRLGVTLAAVSQWRSGATTPTADNTLQILAWLRNREARPQQQKISAGSASTRPARKPREAHDQNEPTSVKKR